LDSPSDLDNSTEINDNKTDSISNLSESITKIYARGFTQDTHSPAIQLESNAPSGGYYTAKVRVCTANNNKICSGKINKPFGKIKIELMPLTKDIMGLSGKLNDSYYYLADNVFQFLGGIT